MSVTTKISRWVIITCFLTLLGTVLYEKGIFSVLYEMDSTFISLGIVFTFVVAHFYVLKAITNYNEHFEDRLWYIAESLINVGMIGTVVGFTMVFGDAFVELDIEDVDSVSALLTTLGSGVGTALITTLTGLVCSLVLKGELVFLVGDHDE